MKLAAAGLFGEVAKDPVCGLNVDESKAKAAGFQSTFNNQTYSFCSRGCKEKFDIMPRGYGSKAADGAAAGQVQGSGADKAPTLTHRLKPRTPFPVKIGETRARPGPAMLHRANPGRGGSWWGPASDNDTGATGPTPPGEMPVTPLDRDPGVAYGGRQRGTSGEDRFGPSRAPRRRRARGIRQTAPRPGQAQGIAYGVANRPSRRSWAPGTRCAATKWRKPRPRPQVSPANSRGTHIIFAPMPAISSSTRTRSAIWGQRPADPRARQCPLRPRPRSWGRSR